MFPKITRKSRAKIHFRMDEFQISNKKIYSVINLWAPVGFVAYHLRNLNAQYSRGKKYERNDDKRVRFIHSKQYTILFEIFKYSNERRLIFADGKKLRDVCVCV